MFEESLRYESVSDDKKYDLAVPEDRADFVKDVRSYSRSCVADENTAVGLALNHALFSDADIPAEESNGETLEEVDEAIVSYGSAKEFVDKYTVLKDEFPFSGAQNVGSNEPFTLFACRQEELSLRDSSPYDKL
jgi:hypothetical protein